MTLASAPSAGAQTRPDPPAPGAGAGTATVTVIQLEGTIDAILADFATRTLRQAGDRTVVIQLNSSRGVLTPQQLDALTSTIADGRVGVWVGPARVGRAGGQAVELLRAAPVRGVASGARIDRTVEGVRPAPTLGDFLVDVMEVPSRVVEREGRPPQREPTVEVHFARPHLTARLLHATTSPAVPYFLIVLGLLLLLLEFYTAGIGLAAGTGALAVALSAYGFGALPTRPGSLALVAVGVAGWAVDLQAGAPRAWTVIGTVAFLTGSLTLYSGMAVPLVVVLLVVAGAALFVGAAMPAMMRARFSTPTIGRESLVGEMGTARTAIDPDGTAEVRGAAWRARTNRATPLVAGAALRVVDIDGPVLEVEPESGGARDYRH